MIGAGRVGTVLGAALARAGHQVVAVSAVSERSRAGPRGCCPACRSAQPPEVLAAADLVLLTVPDDALPGLVAGLAATGAPVDGPAARAHQRPARHRRAGPGHPARRAAAGAAPGDDVHRAPGRPGPAGRDLLRGDRAGPAPAGRRGAGDRDGRRAGVHRRRRPAALYHAALASAANHLVALVAQSADLLRAAGVAEPSRMLAPLLSAALDNALRLGRRRA